jgi:hypothetical protein
VGIERIAAGNDGGANGGFIAGNFASRTSAFGPTSFPLFHGWRAVIAVLVSTIGSFGWELPVCGSP